MNRRLPQRGATLVVSLVMLVVLTLLAVSAIRFGLINLKISGNVQAETEATAAAQIAVEQVIEQMVAASSVDAIAAAAPNIDTGGKTYTVQVAKPTCLISVPLLNSQLDRTKPADIPCFEGGDPDRAITASGALSSTPSTCNQQQWDIQASVADASTGAQVTINQGVAIRVPALTACN